VETDPVEAAAATEPVGAYRIEVDGLCFGFDSCLLMPLAGAEAMRSPLLALAQALKFLAEHEDYGLVIVGHTSVSGPSHYNEELSGRRAECVRMLFEGDRAGWVELAKREGQVLDYKALFAYLTRTQAWPCDPGAVNNDFTRETADAVRSFQSYYNTLFDASIAVDGDVGEQTWGAMFDVLHHEWNLLLEENELSADPPRWLDEGNKTVKCGERYAAHAEMPEGPLPDFRRIVDLVLIPLEDAVRLPGGPPGATIYDAYTLEPVAVSIRSVAVAAVLRLILEDSEDGAFAGKKYFLRFAGQTREGETGEDGLVEERIPLVAERADLTVWLDNHADGEIYRLELEIGALALDPIDEVKGVQARLNHLGFAPGDVDGVEGSSTIAAVEFFQYEQQLPADGSLNDETRSRLQQEHIA
jgi:peptidoglycan hydrolase-like protein with peptidoglycan-binding domain